MFNAGLFALEIALGACVLRTVVAWSDGSMTWVLAGGVVAVGLLTVVGSLLVCAAIAQFEGDFLGNAFSELRSSALMTISAGVPLDGLPLRTDDPRWHEVMHDVDATHSGSGRVGGLCAAVVRSDQGVAGFLVVGGREGALDSFTATDLSRLRTLADQLAGAVARGLMHRHLEFEAHHDLLTGLANRATFERDLTDLRQRALEQASTAFVVMCDLDRFKEVNDTLGHYAGDQLLVEVAHRLANVTQTGDADSALLRASDADSAALLRRSGDADSALLRRADVAMYHAKQNHLGHEFYRDEIDRRTPARLSMLADLRTAIDRAGIELHYQPKLDLVSNVVSGAEVLARWRHPTR